MADDDEIFRPSIENDILLAAIALFRKGDGHKFRCFLSERDRQRLLEEFGKPVKRLMFTRFSVEFVDAPCQTSMVSGNSYRTDLRYPPHLVKLDVVETNEPSRKGRR